MSEVWMVTDLSQPTPYSGVREPEFGPFENREAAEEFASQCSAYWAHNIARRVGRSADA